MFLFVGDIPDFRGLLWLPFLHHCQCYKSLDLHETTAGRRLGCFCANLSSSVEFELHLSVPLSVKCTNGGVLVSNPAAPEQMLKVSRTTDAGPRSAPETDVAHGLAGGAALCRREVDLATGADAQFVQGLFLGGLAWRRCVDAERKIPQLNGVGI